MQRIIVAGARIVLIIKRIGRFRRALALNRAKYHILSAMTLIPRAEVRKGKPYIQASRSYGFGPLTRPSFPRRAGFLGAVRRKSFPFALAAFLAAGEKVRMNGQCRSAQHAGIFLASPNI
jgi:hypothetical protein